MTMHRQHWTRLLLTALVCVLVGRMAAAFTPTQQGNRLLINGTPVALTFARGCRDVQEIPYYRSLGFNTLLVTVNSPGSRFLAENNALITAAEKAGLYILIEVADGNWSAGQYADPNSADYVRNATYFLDSVVPNLRAHPNIVGWVISTVDEKRSITNVGAFADYLKLKYGTVERLRDEWSVKDDDGKVTAAPTILNFAMLDQLPIESYAKLSTNQVVRSKMSDDYTAYQTIYKSRDAALQTYLRQCYADDFDALREDWFTVREKTAVKDWKDLTIEGIHQRERTHPGQLVAPALELAKFRADVTVSLMNWWAKQVASRDTGRLIFAGSQHNYRTLITLPRVFNGTLTECYPGYSEADLVSQNPHAIDMARRGNQFIVLAGVLASNVAPLDLANAMYTATVHGATGICVSDWDAIRSTYDDGGDISYAQTVHSALTDIWQRNLLGRSPAPTTAIVYSPYATGVRGGRMGPYGYMEYFLYPGPSQLFFTIRNGTAFGQCDYLAADDLPRLPLNRYSTILLPSVLDLPEDAQEALLQYTRAGGMVVADLGLGTLQANKNLHFLSQTMMELFRVHNVPGLETTRLNLEVYEANVPCFPSLLQGQRTNGMADGYVVTRIARMLPYGGAQLLFSTVAKTEIKQPTTPRPREILPLKPTRGVFLYRQGDGYAIYAPFPLYQFWTPANFLFNAFHRDLFGNNPSVVLEPFTDLLPPESTVARYTDGSVVVWTKRQIAPEAQVRNPERRLYNVSSGRCLLTSDNTILQFDHPGFHVADVLPIFVEPASYAIGVTSQGVSAQAMEFVVEPQDVAKDAQPLILHIANGLYPVTAASQHRVIITTADGRQMTVVAADTRGFLNLALPAMSCRLRIEQLNTSGTEPQDEIPVDVIPLEVTPPTK